MNPGATENLSHFWVFDKFRVVQRVALIFHRGHDAEKTAQEALLLPVMTTRSDEAPTSEMAQPTPSAKVRFLMLPARSQSRP
jgi:hypothetical protein